MELRHLRYFSAVAEERNFTRAAARLSIAQPPLSRQIRDLEEELGVPLFERGPRSLVLTEEGALFLHYARQILTLADRAVEEVHEMRSGLSGTLYLASVEGHGPKLLAGWVSRFKQDHPNVTYNLWSGNSEDVIDHVQNGLSDIGVILEPCTAEGLNSLPIYSEPWIAMIPVGHPLAVLPGDTISLSQLASYELILPSRKSRILEIKSWFDMAGIEPNILIEMAHVMSAYALVEKNVGIAIFPLSSIERIRTEKLCIKKITDPEVRATYALIWSKNRVLTHLTKKYLEFIRESSYTPGEDR